MKTSFQPDEREPVAWRVKDYADGWILFTNRADAIRQAIETGAVLQALCVRYPTGANDEGTSS